MLVELDIHLIAGLGYLRFEISASLSALWRVRVFPVLRVEAFHGHFALEVAPDSGVVR